MSFILCHRIKLEVSFRILIISINLITHSLFKKTLRNNSVQKRFKELFAELCVYVFLPEIILNLKTVFSPEIFLIHLKFNLI
jgi:hypothetical protein